MPFMVVTFTIMMTLQFIVDAIEMTLRKERRGMLKKSQIETAVRVGINNYFDKQLTVYRVSGIIPTPLQPLITTEEVDVDAGIAIVPQYFSKEVSFCLNNANSNPSQFVGRREFEERKNSVILPPTEADPIATMEGGQIFVRPQNAISLTLTYIKQPTLVVIGTTPSQDQRSLVFNEATSTDTEFYVECAPDIIKEALQFLSVPQQDQNAAQLASTTKI